MYIEPNTVVKLCANTGLNNRYTDTMDFNDVNAQSEWFNNKVKFTLDNNSYQRVNIGVFRAALSADDCMYCDYMMFQNTSYSGKWIYAFINRVEYVANDRCDIYFEIDVLQTFWFNWNFLECFVEREHVEDDTVGANTTDEGLTTGNEYVIVSTNSVECGSMQVQIIATDTPDDISTAYWTNKNHTRNNIFAGVEEFSGVSANSADVIGAELNKFAKAGKSEAIIQMGEYPSILDECNENNNWTLTKTYSFIRNNELGADNYGGKYTPKNNKLYCYPYNILVGTNLQGETHNFKWEEFKDPATAEFAMLGVRFPTPQLALYPTAYRGISADYDSALNLASFPVCAWNNDYYANWLAQNQYRMSNALVTAGISGVSSIVNSGIQGAIKGGSVGASVGVAGGAAEAGLNVFNTIRDLNTESKSASIMPDNLGGGLARSTLNAVYTFQYHFRIYQMSCRAEYLKIIDDYFELFGYKINRIKIPTHSRPHWNFIKTVGCKIRGNLPAMIQAQICDIFDKGVTLWKNGTVIGDYSQNNH